MKDIVIYTKPGFPFCDGFEEYLNERDIPYTEYNVKKDPSTLKTMLELNGGRRHVPTILKGKQVTIGFQGIYCSLS